jgi:hypothetical protein
MVCSREALSSEPSLKRYVFYKLLTLIPVSAVLVALVRHAESLFWIGCYMGLCLVHAAVMNAIKCPHCAYYKMGEKTFSCFMWWRTPRLYRPRPGPESRFVSVYAPIGMLVLTAFPLFWLWHDWALLVIYLLSVAVIVLSIGLNECTRCLNFSCGHNTVSDAVREEFIRSAGRQGRA